MERRNIKGERNERSNVAVQFALGKAVRSGILYTGVRNADIVSHLFFRCCLMAQVAGSMHNVAVGIKIHRTVHHRFKLAAHIFREPAGFIFTVIPCGRCGAGIIKVSPVFIIGLISILFGEIPEPHHLIEDIALTFLRAVRIFKRIVIGRI